MNSAQKWQTLHKYRTAAVRGEVPQLTCPDCGSIIVPVVSTEQEPELKCLPCRTVFHIGLYTWDQMVENLKENDNA